MSAKRIFSFAVIAVSAIAMSTAAFSQPPAGAGRGGAGAAGRGGAAAGAQAGGRGGAAPAPGGGLVAAPANVASLPKQKVTVAQGETEGFVEDGVAGFLSLPFAAPPVGDLRWKVPQPAAKWSGVRDATKPQQSCAQSEDCLYLSVYAPAGAKPSDKLPVMFWIHGGSFTAVTSGPFDGKPFAKQGVILVVASYRLGRAGFFAHPALTKEGQPANFGLLDQISGLKWVQSNIGRFGGDPKKVTIFGESAGAVSVMYLTVMPEARGLFARAISESGFPRNVPGAVKNIEDYAVKAATAAGVTGDGPAAAAALRRLPLDAFPRANGYFDVTRPYPTIDGKSLKWSITEGYEKGENRVPLMIGGNSRDASLYNMQPANLAEVPNRAGMTAAFNPGGRISEAQLINDYWTALRMTEPNRNIARLASRKGTPVYLFYFSYEAPAARVGTGLRGATHTAEIPYVFVQRNPTGENLSTAQSMSAYWLSFAKYGDPGAAGGPRWEKYDAARDNLLEFGNTGPKVTTKLLDAQLNFVERQPHT